MQKLREIFGIDTPVSPNDLNAPKPEDPASVAADDLTLSFEPGSFAIDEYRPMKVIVIGAGLSGILAGIRFRQYIPNLDLTIYEKEAHLGGTWYMNRYPGVACDIPAHCYQYTFEKKSDWSAFYSPGAEILASIEDIAKKYKIEPAIQFRHELVHARYGEESGKWYVKIKRPAPSNPSEYEEIEDYADFVFLGVGVLSRWTWPELDGLHDYKGTLVHSANWNLGGATWQDDVKDWGDKNVAVIGLGCSALQIVSALQDKVKQLTQYARSRTWVSPSSARPILSELLSRDVSKEENVVFTDEDKKSFATNPEKARNFRVKVGNEMQSSHTYTLRGSPLQLMLQDVFKTYMTDSLAKRPDIAAQLIPNFSVACRRISPAPGYLKSLTRDNVEFVANPIKRVTADSIETADGHSIKHDIIICATGFDVSFQFPFQVIGRNGAILREKWADDPMTYMSICADGFPNLFMCGGPNSAIGAGSFLLMLEHQVDYAVKAAQKLQRERIKSIEVKVEAVQDFEEVMKHYFPKTVFTESVSTWYKRGQKDGRVTAIWPGSGLHHLRALRYPRWEDFNYEYLDKSGNRLHWLGNGMTVSEQTPDGYRAWYLDEDYVDVPPVPA